MHRITQHEPDDVFRRVSGHAEVIHAYNDVISYLLTSLLAHPHTSSVVYLVHVIELGKYVQSAYVKSNTVHIQVTSQTGHITQSS